MIGCLVVERFRDYTHGGLERHLQNPEVLTRVFTKFAEQFLIVFDVSFDDDTLRFIYALCTALCRCLCSVLRSRP